jgi:hypothetical protein
MSDLRDELENAFSSAEQQSETQETSNVIEEQPKASDPAVNDEWLDAPNSYTNEYKENFKDLPQNWRKYLTEREKQVEKGFSDFGNKINNYRFSDNIFNARQERLAKAGFNKAQDYFEYLTAIDDALDKDPTSAVRAIAEAYGINFNGNNSQPQDGAIQRQLSEMQELLKSQQNYIQSQQRQSADKQVLDFTNAKDDNGNLKHPYLNDVREQMVEFLNKGICQDLEKAYDLAVYANPEVRAKLIAEQTKQSLNSKVIQAEKAKEIGFNPKAKETPSETAPKSIREELEEAYNKFGD